MSGGGGGGLEDFSFYSEIFWEATSEASNIFCWVLCNKKKIFGGYSTTFCRFSAFQSLLSQIQTFLILHIGVDSKLRFHTH